MSKLARVARQELGGFHPRLTLARLLQAFVPVYTGGRLRAQILRLAGFHIGKGTTFWGAPTILGGGNIYSRLTIGRNIVFNVGCFFDLADSITIEDGCGVGSEVMLITGAHEIGQRIQRLGRLTPKPIHIGAGTWLGARCLVLPGVTVGDGAVVAAGAVVTRDVPPDVVVAGIPARVIRQLRPDEPVSELDGLSLANLSGFMTRIDIDSH